MNAVSDRATDAFDNDTKSAYRARHLDVLRGQVPELWSDDSPGLKGSWLELMGSTGWKTLDLLVGEGVLTPVSFVGADLDATRIADYRARYPAARWIAGDVLDFVERPELEDVSVVHFDGYETVASSRLEHVGEQLGVILRRAVARQGAALLLWNSDLDATRLHGQPAAPALRQHAATLAAILANAAGERRVVTPETLLPVGTEEAVTARAFVGDVGAFEIYRGKSTGHRMACCRVILR